MGRKSTKENKNIYQQCRENAELTRDRAGELLDFMSSDRIERIESEKSLPQPDEVMAMADCYRTPELCNYYCSHECPIGKKYVPEVQIKELSQIVLETVATLNSLDKEKNRLIEIAVDGKINDDELEDFKRISSNLNKVSMAVDSLHLWVERTIARGELKEDDLK